MKKVIVMLLLSLFMTGFASSLSNNHQINEVIRKLNIIFIDIINEKHEYFLLDIHNCLKCQIRKYGKNEKISLIIPFYGEVSDV
ncbi:hypothetical protein [Eggerthia catenaformis]|uniref:hypothetical protein n=1 Tax=Eggerthia catenaformis TaxID=31973 RepID=UPI00248E2052|nr:hypothetical protein [Eggerthia catenaformis]